MTKDEALALALEALEYIYEGANNQGPHTGISWRCVAVKAEPAITAIKQARALDKMADNARELGLDYEPHKGLSEHLAQVANGRVRIDPVTGDVGIGTPAAPVQEPVAWVCYGAPGKRDIDFEETDINKLPIGTLLYTTPPAAQRQWVGLTDEEVENFVATLWPFAEEPVRDRLRAIEAKLKEKNHV